MSRKGSKSPQLPSWILPLAWLLFSGALLLLMALLGYELAR